MRNEEKKSRGGGREEHKTAWDISVMFVNLQMSWVKDFCLLIMKKKNIGFHARADVCGTEAAGQGIGANDLEESPWNEQKSVEEL